MSQRRSSFEPQFDISVVRRHVEAWVENHGSHGDPFWDAQVLTPIAQELGINRAIDTPRLKSQVRRVLDKMADQGKLHKESQGGFGQGKAITYFYPIDIWRIKSEKEEADARRRRETKERTEAQWAFINGALMGFDIHGTGPLTEAPRLSQATWTQLLTLIHDAKHQSEN